MKCYKNVITLLLSSALLFSFTQISNAEKYQKINYNKIFGKDRFETAIELSKTTYQSSKTAIIADSNNLEDTIDALNASAYLKAPLLFYDLESEPKIINELSRLHSSEIYSNLNVKLNNCDIKKLPKFYDYKNKSAVLVSNITDGIVAASYARNTNQSLVYFDTKNETEILNKLKEIGTENLTIIGGINSIPEIKETSFNIKRIAGNDRYETSKLLVKESGNNNVILTSGENVIDSLASTGLSEKKKSTILLCKNDASNINLNEYNINCIVGGLVKIKMNVYYLIPHQDDEVLQIGIDIYRDVKNGDNVNVILFTDGSRTSAIRDINNRLQREGKKEITSEEISKARDKEFELALSHLGIKPENISYLGYINKGLLKSDVTRILENIISDKNNIVFKTLSRELVNHADGSLDHLAITWATEYMEEQHNIPASYYVRSEKDSILTYRKYKTISLSDEEKDIMRNALSAYTIWNPNKGFYAVGGHSVWGSIQNKKKNPIYYIEE